MNSNMRVRCGRPRVVMCIGLLALLWQPQASYGQVTPEFSAAARGVLSANYGNSNVSGQSVVSDFSDTALLMGLRQKLYSNWRSSFVVGMQFPDADSDLGQVFYHQVFIQVENRSNIVKFGRSRLLGKFVDFPTLRDDDALRMTDILNPFATGENTEDSQFGNVLEYTRIFGQKVWLTGHGEHYAESAFVDPEQKDDFALNSLGAQLEYRVPSAQRWNRNIIQQVGIGVNGFFLDEKHLGSGKEETITNAIASAVVNIHPDPINFWDFRAQVIYNDGLAGLTRMESLVDLALARSTSLFGSIRYLKRTLERPSFQIALSGGFKSYSDVDVTTDQWQVIGIGALRAGEGFDLVGQVQYSQQRGDLARILGKDELRVQVGFIYGFERVFNSHFGDRNSLLNLEHDYIP